MCEPDDAVLGSGFSGIYCRLMETYRMDQTVLSEQLQIILERVKAEQSKDRRKGAKPHEN